MKRWIALIMSFLPLVASAAGFWDGNAALQRGDSSFESGLYAVSDSFAPETVIDVENLDTGRRARVTVSQGAPSQASILVLLSPRAAEALGIAAGTVARVRVTLAARAPSDLASLDQDRLQNPDPEINPAVAAAAQEPAQSPPPQEPASAQPAPAQPEPAQPVAAQVVTSAEPQVVQPEPAAAVQPEPSPDRLAAAPAVTAPAKPAVPEMPLEVAPTQPDAAEPAAEPLPQPAAQPAPSQPVAAEPAAVEQAPAAEPTSDDERLLQELAARSPQKQLFLPPREDEKFAYQEPVEPPAAGAPPAVEVAAAPAAEVVAAVPAAEPPAVAEPQELPEVPLAAEQPGVVPLGIESVGNGAGPALPEPAGLAHAEAPLEAVPELSDQAVAATPESLAVGMLPVPEAAAPAPQQAPQPPAQPEPAPVAPAVAAAPAQQPAETPMAAPAIEVKPAAPVQVASLPPAAQPPAGPAPRAPAQQQPQPAPAKPPAGTPYYVQLAAYASESLATGLAASLAATYPVLVLTPTAGGRQVYRVLVGPLNKAESGTLLRWFRSRGFPDAFVKQQ